MLIHVCVCCPQVRIFLQHNPSNYTSNSFQTLWLSYLVGTSASWDVVFKNPPVLTPSSNRRLHVW